MLLKVGELARHTGLTVRTLHHYDSIGLLCPSARSEAGYRLYSHADVARLHAVQALRHLGLGLAEIGTLLADSGESLPAIIARQIRALDHDIAQATELRSRLALLQERFAQGAQPETRDLLASLSLMATYGKYFSAAELKTIFENYQKVKPEWPPLFAAVRDAMERGVPPDSPQIQPVIHRWMRLMLRWMNGDFDLMARWGEMYERDAQALRGEGPDLAMTRYVRAASNARMAVLSKYFDIEQLRRFGNVADEDWQALNRDARALMRRGGAPAGRAAQALVQRRQALLDRLTGGDTAVQQALLSAYDNEPMLAATGMLEPPVRAFLQEARKAAERQEA